MNENELRQKVEHIVRETLKNKINEQKRIEESYHIDDIEEIMEYMWLKPQHTGLDVDIFVDDGGSYKIHHHKLLLLVRNGYDKKCSEFIPISIDEKPYIMDNDINIQIDKNSVYSVFKFIQTNLKYLFALSNRRITQEDFIKCIKRNVSINESLQLNKMSLLRKTETNLPMDIWVDEGATFLGHAPRLKFRASNEQKTTREFSSMTLTDPPMVINLPDNTNLKSKEIDKLKLFVLANLDNLIKLANGEIDLTTEFKPSMIV